MSAEITPEDHELARRHGFRRDGLCGRSSRLLPPPAALHEVFEPRDEVNRAGRTSGQFGSAQARQRHLLGPGVDEAGHAAGTFEERYDGHETVVAPIGMRAWIRLRAKLSRSPRWHARAHHPRGHRAKATPRQTAPIRRPPSLMPATPASITLRNSMTRPKAPATPAAIDLANLPEAGAPAMALPARDSGLEKKLAPPALRTGVGPEGWRDASIAAARRSKPSGFQ